MARKILPFFIIGSGLLSGCIAYSNHCAIDSSNVIGHSEVAFDITPARLRSREATVGNLVADAIYYAANNQEGISASLAIIPAWQFSTTSLCGSRQEIPPGDITENDISYLLGNDSKQTLVTIAFTPTELKQLLEHSVAKSGDATAEPEAIQFLQVSGELAFSVDCSQQPYQVCHDGSEYAGLRVDNSSIYLGKKGHRITLDNWPANEPILVATTWNFAQGHNGYDFVENCPVAATLAINLEDAVKRYIGEISPITTDKVSTVMTNGQDLQFGRIRLLENCF